MYFSLILARFQPLGILSQYTGGNEPHSNLIVYPGVSYDEVRPGMVYFVSVIYPLSVYRVILSILCDISTIESS